MRPVPIVLTLALMAAGCISPQDLEGEPPAGVPSQGGTMSGRESREEAVTPCTGGITIPGGAAAFCMTRTVSLAGELSGIPLLDVALDTFNGPLSVTGDAPAGQWSAQVVLKGRGATQEAARQAIDDIAFSWTHERGGGHILEIIARYEGASDGRGASIELHVPRDQVMRLVADTSNGDLALRSLRTDGLAADTSNGGIEVDADVTQVVLDTSNGAIDARLRPTGDGRWSIDTSNGRIELRVPEGAAYGYDIDASTSNGKVDFGLRDGTATPCGERDCDDRSFRTARFEGRQHQVRAVLDTSNGAISVSST